MLNLNVYLKTEANPQGSSFYVQCPFELDCATDTDLDIFKKEIQTLYWAFGTERPVCMYENEINKKEFEDDI